MSRPPLGSFLIAILSLAALPVAAVPDPPDGRGYRKEGREDEREYRHDWREHDRREERYWKEREGREHRPHRYEWDEHDRGLHKGHRAPAWIDGYWREGETRRYIALVPGDPSRMYVFLDGRWVLRQVRDPRARLDLEGAFALPMAPPPIAPPRVGLNLHVVLFN